MKKKIICMLLAVMCCCASVVMVNVSHVQADGVVVNDTECDTHNYGPECGGYTEEPTTHTYTKANGDKARCSYTRYAGTTLMVCQNYVLTAPGANLWIKCGATDYSATAGHSHGGVDHSACGEPDHNYCNLADQWS